MLEQWLHISSTTAQLCFGGCLDQKQTVGSTPGQVVKSNQPGLAKLLAKRNATAAASNNGGYAYFAMAQWMTKTFGAYPQYPTAW
jgi:hypothetical protein